MSFLVIISVVKYDGLVKKRLGLAIDSRFAYRSAIKFSLQDYKPDSLRPVEEQS
jgi:hypothetical protein